MGVYQLMCVICIMHGCACVRACVLVSFRCALHTVSWTSQGCACVYILYVYVYESKGRGTTLGAGKTICAHFPLTNQTHVAFSVIVEMIVMIYGRTDWQEMEGGWQSVRFCHENSEATRLAKCLPYNKIIITINKGANHTILMGQTLLSALGKLYIRYIYSYGRRMQ